ncbi:unnamed protein product [Discosporangium mesarthrocarpum]
MLALKVGALALVSLFQSLGSLAFAPICPFRPITPWGQTSLVKHGMAEVELKVFNIGAQSRNRRSSMYRQAINSEDLDKAFDLLESYIREAELAGEEKDYDRVRGLVPHMRKRWWAASAKDQDKMADDLGMGPLQYASKEFMPGLEAKPWWEAETFPWAKQLEEASPIIQEEYQNFRECKDSQEVFRPSKEGGYISQGWTHVPLKNSRDMEAGYDKFRNAFPETLKLLDDLGILPNARGVMIARQNPDSGIKMHSDGSNLVISAHLGLDVPGENDCWISVGAEMEKRYWKNNKVLFMDNSFMHWTRNNTDKERIILFFNVWHPDIAPKEKLFLEYLDSLIRHASGGLPLPPLPHIPAKSSGP